MLASIGLTMGNKPLCRLEETNSVVCLVPKALGVAHKVNGRLLHAASQVVFPDG